MSKQDAGKIRFGLIPPKALERVAAVFTEGAKDKGDFGWRTRHNAEARYRDALRRHENKSAQGEVRDAQSGESHWAHVATNALICLDLEQRREAAEKAADEAVRERCRSFLRASCGIPLGFFRDHQVEHLDGHEVRVPRVPEYPRCPRYSRLQLANATRAAHRALTTQVGEAVDCADPLRKAADLVVFALVGAGLDAVSTKKPTRCGVREHRHEVLITLEGFRFGVLSYDAFSHRVGLQFYTEDFGASAL